MSSRAFLIACFALTLSCKRSEAPAPVPAPVAAPTPVDAAAVPAAPPAGSVIEAPAEPALTPCQRACSVSGNRKQMEGFVRCQRKGAAALDDCKAKVLAETDAARAACRAACK
jgi:hypothetical protein